MGVTVNNETRVESMGNFNCEFRLVDGIWRVSSNEVARLFNKPNHGAMVRDMKEKSPSTWELLSIDNRGLEDILKSSHTNSNNKSHSEYLFSRTAFFCLVIPFKGKLGEQFRLAFVKKFEELENMVAKVARGEINLQDDAIELVNNMVGNDEVANMCDFSQYISSHRSGVSMSNQKLYMILRDMQFIYKDRNCNTVLGSPYLTTVIDKIHLTSSIKPYKETFPALLNKIVTFLEKNDHSLKECMGIHSSVNLVDNIEFCKLPTKDDPTYIVNEDSKVKFMDGLGLKQQYDKVNKGLEKFDLAVSAKAMELTIDNDIDYEVKILIPSHHPKDSTPTIKDGVCIGYTKTIPGGSITWND